MSAINTPSSLSTTAEILLARRKLKSCIVNTASKLNRFIVDEELEKHQHSVENAIKLVKSNISNLEVDLDQEFKSPICLDSRSTSTNRSTSTIRSSKSSNLSFIGCDQWDYLAEQVSFTDNEINLVHSIFMMIQEKGIIKADKFWKLIHCLHNTEDISLQEFLTDHSLSFDEASGANRKKLPSLASFEFRYMHEDSLWCRNTFKLLDAYEIGSLTFFEFALVFGIFCGRTLELSRAQFIFDVLNANSDNSCLVQEDILPILETLPPEVMNDFQYCFNRINRNYLTFIEFEKLCALNLFESLFNFYTLSFEDVCSKFQNLKLQNLKLNLS